VLRYERTNILLIRDLHCICTVTKTLRAIFCTSLLIKLRTPQPFFKSQVPFKGYICMCKSYKLTGYYNYYGEHGCSLTARWSDRDELFFIDIHATCKLYVQVRTQNHYLFKCAKNVERGQGLMSFYFWTNID
jgi:hypothetical protein